jgi:hypothetical protein
MGDLLTVSRARRERLVDICRQWAGFSPQPESNEAPGLQQRNWGAYMLVDEQDSNILTLGELAERGFDTMNLRFCEIYLRTEATL